MTSNLKPGTYSMTNGYAPGSCAHETQDYEGNLKLPCLAILHFRWNTHVQFFHSSGFWLRRILWKARQSKFALKQIYSDSPRWWSFQVEVWRLTVFHFWQWAFTTIKNNPNLGIVHGQTSNAMVSTPGSSSVTVARYVPGTWAINPLQPWIVEQIGSTLYYW